MAKIKKLLKALETGGWEPAEQRGELVQFAHPKRAGRITLPNQKCTVPDEIVAQVLTAAGIKRKGA
jgi:predicted RNA binding protein YcfA (HicA-like mRNA interferase family)